MTEKADNSLREAISALVDGEAEELELRRILKSSEQEREDSGESARQIWRRYQLMSVVMCGELKEPVFATGSDLDLSARVAAAIENLDSGNGPVSESDFGNDSASGQSRQSFPANNEFGKPAFATLASGRWYAGAGKVAVAASVCLVMLLGASQYSVNRDNSVLGDSDLASTNSSGERPGDTSAVVPEGYQDQVPSLNAMTVSSHLTPVYKKVGPAQAAADAELQSRLQRMLFLHAENASAEVGLTVVPVSRLSRQDSPEE